jgi:predicted NACHT family NTPase
LSSRMRTYNWTRLWRERPSDAEAAPDIFSGEGKAFGQIAHLPCLVLLGEPGMGKTHELLAECEALSRPPSEGDATCWKDLNAYTTSDDLVHDVFESEPFASWSSGTHNLTLFLDSLDECKIEIKPVAKRLGVHLTRYPTDRLRLRIACRTADWSPVLERYLRQAWGDDSVGVYELQPLSLQDVGEAAQVNGLDPQAFWRQVELAGVVPLAEKPVTLELLLGTYRPGEPFPSTQSQLYADGCLRLCEEVNEEWLDHGHVGRLTPEQRLAVAKRIAAVTILGRKPIIRKQSGRGDQIIAHRGLAGGIETVGEDSFPVTEAAVEEVVGKALFSSRGEGSLGWSHQTFGEFLAARYLVDHELRLPQIMDLLAHPDDPEGKLVPQLHEVAAWAGTMRPDVFREIMRIDPEALLNSNAATADDTDRANLIQALLERCERGETDPRRWANRHRFRKLEHPGLAGQLEAYIRDRSRGVDARYLAIDIAEACGIRELSQQLADVVLDADDVYRVRVNAAYALSRIGESDARARLGPLAIGEVGQDPHDELKGCALSALWPGLINAQELFAALTPPRDEHLAGAYSLFLGSFPIRHLAPEDLPAAMAWVEEQAQREHLPYRFDDLIYDGMDRAWQNLDAPGVLDAFARAALALLRQSAMPRGIGRRHQLKKEELLAEPGRRRRVLEAMLPMLNDLDNDPGRLLYSDTPYLRGEDVPWLLERLDATDSEDKKGVLVQLAFDAFHASDRSHLDAIYEAKERHPALERLFGPVFNPVELDSPAAREAKEWYRKQQEWSMRHDAPLLEPSPAQRIAKKLDEFEAGDLDAWWHLNMEMTLEPRSTHYGDEIEPDLTELPGWRDADPPTRLRIVAAAKSYVVGQDPKTHKWLGKKIHHRPAYAGYRALRLLMKEDPEYLTTMGSGVWRKWAPITLAYPTETGTDKEAPVRRLVALAYNYAPEDIISTLMVLIDEDNKQFDTVFDVRKVADCWDDRLAGAVLEKAKDERLKPGCMESLLDALLEHGFEGPIGYARSILPSSAPVRDHVVRSVKAARVLMIHREDLAWQLVWPLMRADQAFGRAVASAVARYSSWHHHAFGERLSEGQLADLYLWLERQFPHSEDNIPLAMHSVTKREQVARWRDSLLDALRLRGTLAACDAIQRIKRELPGLEWLNRTLLEARNLARRNTWRPPSPDDILGLSAQNDARFVRSAHQLLEAVLESLHRLEEKLQRSDTPAAIDLWNEKGSGQFYPKDEKRLSDYIKRHLDDELRRRGVVLAREVEVRRGQLTDIYVAAFVQPPGESEPDRVTVVIEVKGCWNRKDLKTAMRAQLLDRYMVQNGHSHGLYVVGWYNCELWDKGDYRKSDAPKWSLEKARAYFGAQAAELSRAGKCVRSFVIDTSLS